MSELSFLIERYITVCIKRQ
uniref:Uncharacterized protein n=1 Tax=Anguilla anguilla TaxID=7936 RepID=A0A0E9U2P0_ANGAN